MSELPTYSVSSKGCVVVGFEPEKVKSAFSELFGVPAEKASAYTDKQKLIKKNLSEQDAEAYRTSLEKIGLEVVIHAHTPGADAPVVIEPKATLDALSLIPTGD